jgi:plastocyanin
MASLNKSARPSGWRAAGIGLGLLGVISMAAGAPGAQPDVAAGPEPPYYLPDAAAARIVTVTANGPAAAGITILTEGLATNETGPKETVAHFGEVYAFSPPLIVVRRDEPTSLSFWNLQDDDDHDFMLADPQGNVLMHVKLTPLKESAFLFTFHREGLFTFYCTLHQPAMSGQILVLPPARAAAARAPEPRPRR